MYVFVYGTLKRDNPNHYVLQAKENGIAEYICDGETKEPVPLIVTTKYQVPFLLDHKGVGEKVRGEVYKIDEKMLQTLDKFERNPEVYLRRLEDIQLFGKGNGNTDLEGKTISAWVFVFHSFHPNLLQEQFLSVYICQNYDELRSLSGKVEPEERSRLLKVLREGVVEN